MSRSVLVASLIAAALVACSAGGVSGVSGVSGDGKSGAATPAEDAGAAAADAAPASDVMPATDYCESIATSFCAFYMRCGRMVAKDQAECRAVFLESCNAKYEPRYVELARAGLLALSRTGIAACVAHLEDVSCVEQAQDLDGPCARMWIGAAPAKAPCGIDVESLVCGPSATCILGLDFCGTCEAAAPRGGACGVSTTRCVSDDACVSGTCVARARPGQACSDTKPCVAGSTCTAGTCAGPIVVGEGAACDARHRCAYRSYCAAGKCARASLVGEPCTSTRGCASGWCDGAKCVAPKGEGAACGADGECSSAQCRGGECTPLPSACIGSSRPGP